MTSLSRRDFLKVSGAVLASLTATSCSVIGRDTAQKELPSALATPAPVAGGQTAVANGRPTLPVDPIRRLLNRAGYGPRLGDWSYVEKVGLTAYLEEQLYPEQIADTATDWVVRNFNLYQMDVDQLMTQEPQDAAVELATATILRAATSKRQLQEVMVEFWSDHFNIYLRKNQFIPLLKLVDDREVIRRHALGKFRDLIRASAQSPAMLVYLDNVRNLATSPNENYARELMELHTLGVYAGYTQKDVQELARALTGWGVGRRGRHEGKFQFDPEQHDPSAKQVLQHTVPADSGVEGVLGVLDMLASHPATATFIATKLVRRFVSDEPPPELVARVAQRFQETDGDIRSLLREIFLSAEFATAPAKLKRPFTFLISALRTTHADIGNAGAGLLPWLRQLGQPLFMWPPPDGYPVDSSAWTNNLLSRWNVAIALLHDQVDHVTVPLTEILSASQLTLAQPAELVDFWAMMTVGQPLNSDTAARLTRYLQAVSRPAPQERRLRDIFGLLLAAPAFQWH